MIRSMTGYGRAEAAGARTILSVECKSVNHRTLDVSLKLPRALNGFESDARRLIQSAVQRGRVDVSVAVTAAEGAVLNPLSVNLAQAREYTEAARTLAEALDLADGPSLGWVMAQSGVLTREEQAPLAPDEAWPLLERALSAALAELLQRRETEGGALGQELAGLGAVLAGHVDTVARRAPAAVERRAARLRERMQAMLAGAEIDQARLATEVAVWADKTDVTEELARLRAHLAQLTALLAGDGPVGRTLDFLIQEINREVNTIGSKADDLEISQAVIAAKSTLEKMREQAANLE
ncbi:MAG TPA: YicC/YloC family endoribonuclease [Candidatus Deferrimicrobiaceae bacterium]|nr:YicC/YloC family endoribonuclease [Candidatus Deferrimicrobiaceae bacterium]